jgi:hypothetical protein
MTSKKTAPRDLPPIASKPAKSKQKNSLESLSGKSAASDSSALRQYKINDKVVKVLPSPGYSPGENSPLKEKIKPLPTDPPPDGTVIVHEMIAETMDDLEDYAEWDVHCCAVSMWCVGVINIFYLFIYSKFSSILSL